MSRKQTHAEMALRKEAFSILESIEELIWAANKRNETVSQTRLYYEKILAGYDPNTPQPRYIDAKWGDETPPAPAPGPDPRLRPRPRQRQDVEMKQEIKEEGGEVRDVRMSDIGETSSSSVGFGVGIAGEQSIKTEAGDIGDPGTPDPVGKSKKKRSRKIDGRDHSGKQ